MDLTLMKPDKDLFVFTNKKTGEVLRFEDKQALENWAFSATTEEVSQLLAEIEEVKKLSTKASDAIKDGVKQRTDNEDVFGSFAVSTRTRSSIDMSKLKEDQPELYDELARRYSKITTYKQISPKKL